MLCSKGNCCNIFADICKLCQMSNIKVNVQFFSIVSFFIIFNTRNNHNCVLCAISKMWNWLFHIYHLQSAGGEHQNKNTSVKFFSLVFFQCLFCADSVFITNAFCEGNNSYLCCVSSLFCLLLLFHLHFYIKTKQNGTKQNPAVCKPP